MTLGRAGFPKACRRLQQLVEASGFTPDAVLGIYTGGKYVADNIFLQLPHVYAGAHRPAAVQKKGWKAAIIRHLPRCVQDWLRIVESRWLEKRTSLENIKALGTEKIEKLPADCRRLLVVDDAIDSGRTMASVTAGLRAIYPWLDIRIAVLTVTTARHAAEADYQLFRPGTLLRCPWAVDIKASDL